MRKPNFNPMKASGEPTNVSAGVHTSRKVGGAANPKGGAGRQIGPGIAKGYLVTGTGNTMPTGGYFRGANKAKLVKKGKSLSMKKLKV
jgi:hypothetical protein